MRPCCLLFAGAHRPLNAGNVLTTIRNDPGMTATYYANRYFGKEHAMQLNHLLWSVLKRNGKIDMDRADGLDAAPRWYPLFASPRLHHVRHHNSDEEDLTVLHQQQQQQQTSPPTAPDAPCMPPSMSTAAASPASDVEEAADMDQLDSTIVGLVEAVPGKDIQFYILELPARFQRRAPGAFRRLREAGLLERRVTEQGTFVWF